MLKKKFVTIFYVSSKKYFYEVYIKYDENKFL